MTQPGTYIDGAWTQTEGAPVLTVVNPATEQPFGQITTSTTAEVDAAVRSAERALTDPAWASLTVEDRIKIVERFAELITENAPELARLRSGSIGAPYKSSLTLSNAVGMIHMYLDSVKKIRFEEVRRDEYGDTYVVRKPVGVVAGIVPWNVPVRNELRKTVPPILSGCTVVLKAAEESPLAAARMMELFTEAGLPPGVINLVTGGPEVGEALVTHPAIRKIAFTGSTATGARIASIAGPELKRVQLELGGKSAAVVLEDAKLEDVLPSLLTFGFGNTGQICAALTRVVVPRSLHDDLVAGLVEGAKRHRVGDPMDDATTMGPLVSSTQRDTVFSYIEKGKAEGAELAVGGGVPEGLDRGYYVEPTVFAHVDNSMTIAQEEIFGPVISVIPYDTEEEAIAIANDSTYGLHGAVFSADPLHALQVAEQIDTGTCAVNGFDVPLSAPFGGVKSSGMGRENGVEGFDEYLEYHSYKLPPALAEQLAGQLR